MEPANLLHILHLSDPSLPIGGFSHSAGLETYVQERIVFDKKTATEFIAQQLAQNIFYTDAAILSLAYDAAADNNFEAVLELDQICSAVKLPTEMRIASIKLGVRLLKVFENEREFIFPDQYFAAIKNGDAVGHYCIAFGLLCAAMHASKQNALTAYYYNAAAGFVTNAVKLIPLGQQDGQEVLMSLFDLLNELIQKSLSPDKEMIGYCCAGFDIRSMQHERLYSRLYMS